MNELEKALLREQEALAEFKKLYSISGFNYEIMINQDWSAKDYLSDVVYWHESFARNIADVGDKRRPHPIQESLREATRKGVEENKSASRIALLRRLSKAQAIIEKHIFDDSISTIPYRKGSRLYNRIEYLDIRTSEFRWHFWEVVEKIFLDGESSATAK